MQHFRFAFSHNVKQGTFFQVWAMILALGSLLRFREMWLASQNAAHSVTTILDTNEKRALRRKGEATADRAECLYALILLQFRVLLSQESYDADTQYIYCVGLCTYVGQGKVQRQAASLPGVVCRLREHA